MTNQVAIVCDYCGNSGPVRQTMARAFNAATVKGWRSVWEGEAYSDQCPDCVQEMANLNRIVDAMTSPTD